MAAPERVAARARAAWLTFVAVELVGAVDLPRQRAQGLVLRRLRRRVGLPRRPPAHDPRPAAPRTAITSSRLPALVFRLLYSTVRAAQLPAVPAARDRPAPRRGGAPAHGHATRRRPAVDRDRGRELVRALRRGQPRHPDRVPDHLQRRARARPHAAAPRRPRRSRSTAATRFGLVAGFGALLCSDVAIVMIAAVGHRRAAPAALARGGAAHAPARGRVPRVDAARTAAGRAPTSTSRRSPARCARASRRRSARSARCRSAAGCSRSCSIVGLAIALRDGSRRGDRRPRSVGVVALALGALIFATMLAVTRFGLGAQFAASSRYLHIIAALLLPSLAVAADAIARRSARARRRGDRAVPRRRSRQHRRDRPQRRARGALPRAAAGDQRAAAHCSSPGRVPRSLHPTPSFAAEVTVGWLLDGARLGAHPARRPRRRRGERATDTLRLSLEQLDGTGAGRSACPLTAAGAAAARPRRDRFGIRGAIAVQSIRVRRGVRRNRCCSARHCWRPPARTRCARSPAHSTLRIAPRSLARRDLCCGPVSARYRSPCGPAPVLLRARAEGRGHRAPRTAEALLPAASVVSRPDRRRHRRRRPAGLGPPAARPLGAAEGPRSRSSPATSRTATTELLDADFVTLSVLREPVERTLSHLRHHRKMNPDARDALARDDLRRRVPARVLREPHGEDVLAHRRGDRDVGRTRHVGDGDAHRLHARAPRSAPRSRSAGSTFSGCTTSSTSSAPSCSRDSAGSSAIRSTRTARPPKPCPRACGRASRPTTRSTSSCSSTRRGAATTSAPGDRLRRRDLPASGAQAPARSRPRGPAGPIRTVNGPGDDLEGVRERRS